ncbi:MAG: HD domain-containing protein [Nitrososphaerales archaeon]|jgi:HD superfamily phosphohydrolase
MTLRYVAEVRDPVHGYIKITEEERAVIDSPFVQRLRRIHQLAGAYMVYPGGVHSRFEHVLGTMHVAGLMAESVADRAGLDEGQIQELRLAALLHDVGHGPFSHLFEEVLTDKTGLTHEDMSQRIVLESSIGSILERRGMSPKRMSQLCVGKQKARPFMNEVIAGGLSADIMDYLLRDSYFTGVEYGKVDIRRVIDSLDVIGEHLVLDQAALYAFEALLIARYEMFKAVYFHRTVRAAELMLAHSMALADEELGLTNLSKIDRYLELTDEVVVYRLNSLKPRNRRLRQARMLAENYNERRLVKCVFEKVMQRKDRVVEKIFSQKRFRNELIADVARQAGVDAEGVYIDVPTTPSVPHTYAREALNSITLVSNDFNGRHSEKVSITELPLVGSITGFTDVLRVYALPDQREKVARAVQVIFGREDFTARISL